MNNWSCLPLSICKILGINLERITKYLGHDGSEIIRPYLSDPHNRRGFHIQEMVEYCLVNHGIKIIVLEVKPQFSCGYEVKTRALEFLDENEAVICGIVAGKNHAVAWDGKRILDPNGTMYFLDKIDPELILLF